MPTRVLLDTDPGSDIDDALAISYLLSQPECDLLGITTVTGNVAERAAIAEVLCEAVSRRHIPIVAGRQAVLAYGPGQPNVPQFAAIADHHPHLDRKPNQAVDFLRDTIRKHPGEITLVSIGPFTNVAILFAIDPEIPHLLKDLISMAGAFQGYGNLEWNCRCDPAATAIVAATPRPRHRWIGLDVTMQCALDREACERQFKGPLLSLVLKMAGTWFEHNDRIVFHDPLAAACVFDPELCSYSRGLVKVRPEDGRTDFAAGGGRDEVALTIDSEKFFNDFFGVIRALG
ncbi:MAG: nucleoside hydrolase [Fimbriimonadaceae bacterium]